MSMLTTAYDVIRCRQCRTGEGTRRQRVVKYRINANAARKQARVGFIHAPASLGSARKLSSNNSTPVVIVGIPKS